MTAVETTVIKCHT